MVSCFNILIETHLYFYNTYTLKKNDVILAFAVVRLAFPTKKVHIIIELTFILGKYLTVHPVRFLPT